MTRNRSKNSAKCGYYLCDSLDCGFYYHYKEKSGPSINKPINRLSVPVVGLDKLVLVKLVGIGDTGLNILLDHGHEGYIFPIHLYNKPFKIDPHLEHEEDEKWQKILAQAKGIPFVSTRKKCDLVDKSGNIIRTKFCNETEWQETLEFQEEWKQRHPGKESMEWRQI